VTRLSLEQLSASCPRLTAAVGKFMAAAASVCLAEQEHELEVSLRVTGEYRTSYLLHRGDVTARMRATYDPDEATEFGACGVVLLVMHDLTGLTAQRAFKGGGFDYWLGPINDQEPFQNLARLEVSGIRRGDKRQVAARMKAKLAQVRRSDSDLPAYVAVVEFSAPEARVVKR
jgi:hypothetical protein